LTAAERRQMSVDWVGKRDNPTMSGASPTGDDV
jgi:hypothetical protein